MCRIVTTTATLTNRRAQQLHCHYWKGQQRRCLVFLSHGFSEHLGLYHEVRASNEGYPKAKVPEDFKITEKAPVRAGLHSVL